MFVVFRADSSIHTGTGHVTRCLALAERLRENSVEVRFISSDSRGNVIGLIEKGGFPVYRIPAHDAEANGIEEPEVMAGILRCQSLSPDWLVLDHYSADEKYESAFRPLAKRIMVIDDLADRRHDCDLLLDQNFYIEADTRYATWVAPDCRLLIGPGFAMLRGEFAEARTLCLPRSEVTRILVFFGGTDPSCETLKVLEALSGISTPLAIDVVVGRTNPRKAEIEERCASMVSAAYHCQVNNMSELLSRADLSLGAGGSTSLERLCLGLPSIVASVAPNQVASCLDMHLEGLIEYLGEHKQVSSQMWRAAITDFMRDPARLTRMSERALKVVDGEGSTRVVEAMMQGMIDG